MALTDSESSGAGRERAAHDSDSASPVAAGRGASETGGAHDPASALPVAATVVLLRDAVHGVEVLMLERPDTGSFAGAWVFPGGKVEPGDRRATVEATHRAAGARETAEEVGLHVHPEALLPLSRWTPPVQAPTRIRTWFFVAPAPDGTVRLQPDEAVAARWLRPADALADHARGDLRLVAPTWVTLHGLAGAGSGSGSVAAVLARVRRAGAEMFDTVIRPDGLKVWAGDDQHPTAPVPGGRHRMVDAKLPWVYTRA